MKKSTTDKGKKPKVSQTKKKAVTRKEFCELCSSNGQKLNYNTLAKHIRQGKVIEKRSRIDPDHKTNKLYTQEIKKFVEQKALDIRSLVDQEKKNIDLAIKKEQLVITQLTRKQKEGEVIPYDLVSIIFNSHFKEVYQQFYFAAERISNDTIAKLKGKKKDAAEMKGNLIAVLNEAINKSRESSKRDVKKLRQEYSETK